MKTLKVYGASDYLIEADGLPGCDEFNVYSSGRHAGRLLIKSKEVKVVVHCIYDGHWCFAVGPYGGDYDEMPSWEIRRKWGADTVYSETLEIDCPDDAKVTFYKKKAT